MRTRCGHREKKKNAKSFINKDLALRNSTQSRDRTGKDLNPLVFETNASTNSAIWAFACCECKSTIFFYITKQFELFFIKLRFLLFCLKIFIYLYSNNRYF